jgi:hypothetical protein
MGETATIKGVETATVKGVENGVVKEDIGCVVLEN